MLATMHLGIFLAMNIFFFDQFLMYMLLIPWDRIHARFSRRETLVAVPSRHDRLGSALLWLFKDIDLLGAVRFDEPVGESRSAVTVRYGDDDATGYDAVRLLCRHLGLLRPLALVMALAPVAFVGRRLYRSSSGVWARRA
jgi:hypothetical protein